MLNERYGLLVFSGRSSISASLLFACDSAVQASLKNRVGEKLGV
jgi:hypothetical protein